MKIETRIRVNEKGCIVIPAPFRKALGINAGDEIILRIEDDQLRITTLKRRLERAKRLVRKHVKPGTSLADELIAERRQVDKSEKDSTTRTYLVEAIRTQGPSSLLRALKRTRAPLTAFGMTIVFEELE
jgi:AbrB family looped-hinge helix DNA binding protein